MMATYQAVLAVHIVSALASVVLFWIPVLVRKGSTQHEEFGRLYVKTMMVMAVTAVILSAINLIDPAEVGSARVYRERAILLNDKTAGESEAFFVGFARLNAVWLGYLGIAIPAGLRHGLRVIQTRNNHAELRHTADLPIAIGLVVSGLAMIGFSIYSEFIIITVFGVTGLINGIRRTFFIVRPPASRQAWLFQHLTALLDSGVTLHVAGLLAVGRYLPGDAGQWRLLPAAFGTLGMPAAALYRRYYRRTFESTARQPLAATPSYGAGPLT